MMDNINDPKLLKILKLKEEFEKDLKKMGKLKEKPKVKRESSGLSKKIKIELTPPALVDASKVNTLFDINHQDYGASDESVIRALKKTIAKVGNIKKRALIEGIIKLLEKKFEEAAEVFSRFAAPEFKYMLGVTKLYKGDTDTLDYTVKFLKTDAKSFYPYLLMAEVLISLGRYQEAIKFLEAAFKISKNPYIGLVHNVYTNNFDVAKKLFPICTNRGGFKTLLAILSIYLEPDYEKAKKIAESILKKEDACTVSIGSYWTGKAPPNVLEKFSYCPRIMVYKLSKKYYSGEDISEVVKNSMLQFIDPVAYLFLGFYYFNEGKNKEADQYFGKFKNMVENVKVSVIKPGIISKVTGMRMFHTPVSGTEVKVLSTLSYDTLNSTLNELVLSTGYKKEELDVKVTFKDPEILKLLFGSRHCRMIYGE